MIEPYRKGSNLDKKSELLAHLFKAIHICYFEDNNLLQHLIQKQNFNLNIIVDPKLQQQWIQEFKLQPNIV